MISRPTAFFSKAAMATMVASSRERSLARLDAGAAFVLAGLAVLPSTGAEAAPRSLAAAMSPATRLVAPGRAVLLAAPFAAGFVARAGRTALLPRATVVLR